MSAIPSWRVGATVGARTPALAPDAEAQPGLRADGRLGVHYALALARGEDAALKAALIGLEQTVELPRALLEADLAERMEIAYRINGRRWDVKFKGRTDVVAFPVDARLAEQLDALNLMQAQSRVLDLPATHIDARHPKYIALRPIPGAAVSSSGDT